MIRALRRIAGGAALAPVLLLLPRGPAATVPSSADPLGATPHAGATTFRVWAPYVHAVSVKINGGAPVAMKQDPGHPDPSDTVWAATVPGARPGDRYTYWIQSAGAAADYVDPRSLQLTPDRAASVIVDPAFHLPPFKTPGFDRMVVYEMHVGTFNPDAQGAYTFRGAAEKLDYLADLGVNAVELLPVHQNAARPGNHPADYNWGYDPVQLFAVNAAYGTPAELADFVAQCHRRNIAVILDVVYNHLYAANLLKGFGGVSTPAMPDGIYFYEANRVNSGFGPRPDFDRPQVRSYVEDNARMWLRTFGMDGLRWDSTMNIRATANRFPNLDGEALLRRANTDIRKIDPKQPGKISIAEDLRNNPDIIRPVRERGFGFDSQWDDDFCVAVRNAVTAALDEQRDLHALAGVLARKYRADNAFTRVIYAENHDQAGHPRNGERRLPALIDPADPASIAAKRRSLLANTLVLTSPGIPMLFQGEEMLDDRDFNFGNATYVDWSRADRFRGIVRATRDLIRLRRDLDHTTTGLTGQNINIFHLDDETRTIAYHRYGPGGPGDDVVVVLNLSSRANPDLRIGFPRAGKWSVRFNSGATQYDSAFTDGETAEPIATPDPLDNLRFSAPVRIGPYSALILSQDRAR